jgi:CRISPR/Cas system CSM-associated protein Csm3 (group 7 of RAMP superfamily)
MFEKLENRAILEYTILTKSDLHVGGHSTIEPAEVDNPVIKNSEGYPIIPGSSLKGILRTETERLLRGLDVNVCNIFDKSKRGGCNECSVCKLFGGKDLASSIRIKDSTALQKKTLIRDGVAIDRQKRKAKDGGKFDLEVVPKGTSFPGKLVIENTGLEGYEYSKLGAILSLFDFFNSCSSSIGHATSRGFGEVEINVENFSLISAEDYFNGNYEGASYQKGSSEYEDMKKRAVTDWASYVNGYKSGKHGSQ